MGNREIDALVAEHVFEWKLSYHNHEDGAWYKYCPDYVNDDGTSVGPDDLSAWDFVCRNNEVAMRKFSTDIAAAWEVVEKISDKMPGVISNIKSNGDVEWGVKFFKNKEIEGVWADTAPLAICKASLKTVGVDVD